MMSPFHLALILASQRVSTREIARKTDMSEAGVADIIRGESNPQKATRQKIAKAFGFDTPEAFIQAQMFKVAFISEYQQKAETLLAFIKAQDDITQRLFTGEIEPELRPSAYIHAGKKFIARGHALADTTPMPEAPKDTPSHKAPQFQAPTVVQTSLGIFNKQKRS